MKTEPPIFLARLLYLQFGLFSLFISLLGLAVLGLLFVEMQMPGIWKDAALYSEGSMLINLTLVVAFGLQHSIMAREGFKKFTSAFIPQQLERNFYVMWSGFFLLMLGALWFRTDVFLYDIRGTAGGLALTCGAAGGIYISAWAVLSMDALDLIGIRQLITNFTGRKPKPAEFRKPFLYRIVRHPLYMGMMIAFWLTPALSTDHVIFASSMTLYLFIGMKFEEKDLLRRFGEVYKSYMDSTPMIFPFRFTKRPKMG